MQFHKETKGVALRTTIIVKEALTKLNIAFWQAKQKLLNTPTARKHGHGHFGRAAAATAY